MVAFGHKRQRGAVRHFVEIFTSFVVWAIWTPTLIWCDVWVPLSQELSTMTILFDKSIWFRVGWVLVRVSWGWLGLSWSSIQPIMTPPPPPPSDIAAQESILAELAPLYTTQTLNVTLGPLYGKVSLLGSWPEVS